jgi:tetratricopeptide (TPR) repeat protein
MRTNGMIGGHATARGQLVSLLIVACVLGTGAKDALAQDAATTCAPAMGRVVSIQGSVDVQRAGSRDWLRIRQLDTGVCPGDRLRTAPLSRAALFVQPETLVRVDQNTTIALRQTATEVLVEFFQDEATPAAPGTPCCGAAYFITRFPKKFKVTTAHLNAAVEGTEFMVTMSREGTELTVLEGVVLSQTATTREERAVTAGNKLVAGQAVAGVITALIKPEDAVQWVLHYPPLSDARTVADVSTAERCHALPTPSNQDCLTERAELLLRLGQIEEALQDIEGVLAFDSRNGDANALRAIIQIAKNDKIAALDSARAAIVSTPDNFRAWLALSYAEQASFELEQALDSARKAQALQADSSLANTRAAELLMSLGRTAAAETSARMAVNNNPAESGAHTMLGFIHLAQINLKQARADFEAAIERDSFSPSPRLGLGLAMIRSGKLNEGREQLEIAVALDPTNSLLRSYVGKAYYEENSKERDELAGTQFALAKQFDPQDPTPWFYEAILEQTQNRPVESLKDLQESVGLNDNRTVYRSRLLLDEDLAARNAQLSRSYRELGFEQLAQAEAYRSLAIDPVDFSGHRFLADAFLDRPRHQFARVSELLQSQIWQPLNVTPIETQLMDDRSFILRNSGPATAGLNEFNPLFVQQGLQLQASGLIGGNDTLGDQILLSGLHDRVSASIGHFYYDSDGFQEGWGLKKDIVSAFVQAQLSPDSSIFGEYRNSEQTQGDLSQNFFGVTDSQRVIQDRELYRLGFRFPLNEWSIAGTLTQQDARDVTEAPVGSLLFRSDTDESAGELLAVYRSSRFYLLLGGGRFRTTGIAEFSGFPFESKGSAGNAFGYVSFEPVADLLRFELGLSWDEVERPDLYPETISRLSPKLGVVFRPRPGTTFRAAAFRSLRRSIIAEQTIEPTQVAGFNQFFDDALGTKSERVGVGWDQKLTATSFAGVEFSKRRLIVPQAFTDPLESFEWNERDYRGYFYLAPYRWLSTAIEYTYERITQHPLFADNFLDAETHKIPISMIFFMSDADLSLRATIMGVRQTGEFRLDPFSPDFASGTSEFWTADIALTYRLPRRRGLITAEVRNLFDETFRYQETDVFSPTLARERLAFLRFSVSL